jgi:hypothetical protein
MWWVPMISSLGNINPNLLGSTCVSNLLFAFFCYEFNFHLIRIIFVLLILSNSCLVL